MTFTWVVGHCGIEGIDEAGALTRDGAKLLCYVPDNIATGIGMRVENLARIKEESLIWLPGHFAIEVADELTRDGTNQPYQNPEPYLGITRKQRISTLNEWTNWLIGNNREDTNLQVGILSFVRKRRGSSPS